VATVTNESAEPGTIPVIGASVVIAHRTPSGGVAVPVVASVVAGGGVPVGGAGSLDVDAGVPVAVSVEDAVAVVDVSVPDPEQPATSPARAAPSARSVALRDPRQERGRRPVGGLEGMDTTSDGLAARG
jgi:hypothetical protein